MNHKNLFSVLDISQMKKLSFTLSILWLDYRTDKSRLIYDFKMKLIGRKYIF